MEVNFMNFITNLKYMGIGMLGVFMIVGIIILSTYAIGYFTAKRQSDDSEGSKLQ